MVKMMPPPEGVKDPLVYNYLYQLQEYLKVMIQNPGTGLGGVEAAQETGSTVGKAVEKELQDQYQALKALIIKTADEVEKKTQIDLSGLRELIENLGELVETDNATLMAIQSDYVAKSEFGEYQEQINQTLIAHGDSLEQQLRMVEQVSANVDAVSADFTAYRIETEGYIRSGIVGRRDDGTPIIGIAIGQDLKVETDAQGNEVTEEVDLGDGRTMTCRIVKQESFRAIYAADELSFWNGEHKVAYMSGNQLYITNVVALGSLRVGSWSVKDEGSAGLVFKWIGG